MIRLPCRGACRCAVAAVIAALLAAVPGCGGARDPKLLYASIASDGNRVVAILALDRTLEPGAGVSVRFEPAPRGSFDVIEQATSSVKVLFREPEPFSPDQNVAVRFAARRGAREATAPLLRGIPHPILESVVWRDASSNGLVDKGDRLLLRFSRPVAVARNDRGAMAEFFLPQGEDALGKWAGDGPVLIASAYDPSTVELLVGDGAYFTPGAGGEPEISLFGFNATFAAPSQAIQAADTKLGAVLSGPGRRPAAVPIRTESEFKPWAKRGDLGLTGEDAGEDPSITFAAGAGRCLVVVAGGRDRKLRTQANAANNLCVFSLDPLAAAAAAPVWVGKLKNERYGHAAVALPVPGTSTLWAAVLFLGGIKAVGDPVLTPELLCVEGPLQARIVEPLGGAIAPPLVPSLVPRREAQAGYVPVDEWNGFVVVAGGDGMPRGSVDILRVAWPGAGANAGDLPLISFVGTVITETPSRTEHTVTVIALPGGEKGVLVFGGLVGDASVAFPFLVIPGRAGRADATLPAIVPVACPEDLGARHGHRAVYLPKQGRVVIIGGVVQSGRREQADISLDATIEFDPAKPHLTVGPGVLHLYKVDPEAVLLPETERILIVGGRDRAGGGLRTVEVYDHPEDSRLEPRFYALGGFMPEEAVGGRCALVPCGAGSAKRTLFLVGGRSAGVWVLSLPE